MSLNPESLKYFSSDAKLVEEFLDTKEMGHLGQTYTNSLQ